MRAFFEQLGHGQTHAQSLMFLYLHLVCMHLVCISSLAPSLAPLRSPDHADDPLNADGPPPQWITLSAVSPE